jgi:hypothetical protein
MYELKHVNAVKLTFLLVNEEIPFRSYDKFDCLLRESCRNRTCALALCVDRSAPYQKHPLCSNSACEDCKISMFFLNVSESMLMFSIRPHLIVRSELLDPPTEKSRGTTQLRTQRTPKEIPSGKPHYNPKGTQKVTPRNPPGVALGYHTS